MKKSMKIIPMKMLGKPMKLFHTAGFHGQYFMDYSWAILVINP